MPFKKTLTTLLSIGRWLSFIQPTKMYNIPTNTNAKTQIIILLCMLKDSGGSERCTLAQHQEFINAGAQSILVCSPESFLAAECQKQNLPFVTCSPFRMSSSWLVFMPGVQSALKSLVTLYQNKILAIHCSYRREVFVAKRVLCKTAIPIVLTQHTPSKLSKAVRKNIDGFIGVSKDITNLLIDHNKQDKIARSTIIALPPFFDYKRCITFQPIQSRETFFKNNFGINLKPLPLIIKAAHLYPHIEHKNHPLLFQALHKLIYTKKIPLQIALAGGGEQLDAYKQMVKDLKLEDYVYFLGNTNQIPALMYYADINLLASSEEAFGIVLLEGGLMQKPTIVARGGCGAADWLIIDQKTGFLFENKNAEDLADKIAYVLANPEQAKTCGQRLREKVIAEFLPDKTAQTTLNFYKQVKNQLLNQASKD